MSKLLIVVDMQNDFIDGSLGVKEAVAIVPKVCAKIREASNSGCEIIFTQDTHDEDYFETQEGTRLPVKHCILGTKGHEIPTCILASVTDQSLHAYTVLKRTFGYSDWKNFLTVAVTPEFGDIKAIEIVGLCTDICVISNALILKSIFPEVPIYVDASCCAGTTPDRHQKALEIMSACQIEVRNS